MRVAIEYADQNESFSPLLPRAGTVVRHLSDKLGNAGWLLVDLDDPFDYQVKVGEPFRFRGTTVTHFLVRSREQGANAGGSETVSVFVLLVEQNMLPIERQIEPRDYIHACWGPAVYSTVPNRTRQTDGRVGRFAPSRVRR